MHDLRHSHVSLLINEGANVQAIADRIGDTVNQVLKTYAHLFEKTEDELIEIIDITGFNTMLSPFCHSPNRVDGDISLMLITMKNKRVFLWVSQ